MGLPFLPKKIFLVDIKGCKLFTFSLQRYNVTCTPRLIQQLSPPENHKIKWKEIRISHSPRFYDLDVLEVAGVGAGAENKSDPTLGFPPSGRHETASCVVQDRHHLNCVLLGISGRIPPRCWVHVSSPPASEGPPHPFPGEENDFVHINRVLGLYCSHTGRHDEAVYTSQIMNFEV